jgi:hypothetical protein
MRKWPFEQFCIDSLLKFIYYLCLLLKQHYKIELYFLAFTLQNFLELDEWVIQTAVLKISLLFSVVTQPCLARSPMSHYSQILLWWPLGMNHNFLYYFIILSLFPTLTRIMHIWRIKLIVAFRSYYKIFRDCLRIMLIKWLMLLWN